MRRSPRSVKLAALVAASAVALSGCGFNPYKLPLPGGADLGNDPYTVKIKFRDVLDLVPQSSVKVDDVSVGKVTDIQLDGWTAVATVKVNRKVDLPDDAEATIRQTSLLGEKFISLAPPPGGGSGRLGNGDVIGLDRSGRNPDIEEVLGAASLLFNGGGLEKTNTIVRELNKALDGNEPEVRELLRTSERFLGQLDDNKTEILGALEKVNRLAVETNKQKKAITGALDQLPEALDVINDQRDDLVGLLQSLDRLSDVATDVIRRSKADTLATLRDLAPTLKALADAGDSLPKATQALLSFPFTDGVVGNSVARAQSTICNSDASNKQKIAEGACFGDYYNLSIRLGLNANQGINLLTGIFSLLKGLAGEGVPTAPAGDAPTAGAGGTSGLVDLVEGLVPQQGATPSLPGASPSTAPSSGSSGSSSKNPTLDLPGFCGLMGSCRTSAQTLDAATTSDVGRILLAPVVTR
ncbi:MAG: MCE family protein [Aeromicrobium erythreum]